jgi:hypothetical protein
MILAMLDSRRVAGAALLLLPAGLVAFFAFNSGGFYPGPRSYVAVLLCVVLALRVTLASQPFYRTSLWSAIPFGAMALYALLTLVSQAWSHAPGRALVEFDLPLLYLLAMLLCGTITHTQAHARWLLRALALVITGVCICGLITRLLPHLWPTTPELANQRLSFPLTYWNALGLFAGLGVILALHLSSEPREQVVVRVLGAAAIPVLATTIYFTFSRGGIAVTLIGLVVYVLFARPRLLLNSAVIATPTTAIAIKYAYDANLLATPTPTTAAAVAQGRHVAVALGVCVAIAALGRWLVAYWVDPRLTTFRLREEQLVRLRRVGWSTLVVAVIVAGIALNGAIAREYHRFIRPAAPGNAVDLRARLTDPGNNGRVDMWRVAWRQFQTAPAVGHGAGTFANTWAQHRIDNDFVVDAHSLYMETLDELGIVGLVLLVTVIIITLTTTALRARGPDRPLYAATFTIMLMWAIHAGVDWDWEMPVVTLPFFALGGFMLSRRRRGTDGTPRADERVRPAPVSRMLVGITCLLLAVAPAYVWLSQRRLNQATAAFAQGDCVTATRSAISSISILGNRPEPYELISYCDIRRDMPSLAITNIQKAISLDPNNWNFRYDLAVMRASAGLNPMPAMEKAVSLDPREPLVQEALQTFRNDGRAHWESDGKSIADQFTSL